MHGLPYKVIVRNRKLFGYSIKVLIIIVQYCQGDFLREFSPPHIQGNWRLSFISLAHTHGRQNLSRGLKICADTNELCSAVRLLSPTKECRDQGKIDKNCTIGGCKDLFLTTLEYTALIGGHREPINNAFIKIIYVGSLSNTIRHGYWE